MHALNAQNDDTIAHLLLQSGGEHPKKVDERFWDLAVHLYETMENAGIADADLAAVLCRYGDGQPGRCYDSSCC